MTLAPGTRLGPYEISAPLGAGGMGEVYRAKDTRLGREVAVKVLPAEVASDRDRLRRFEQEARATSAIQHSNLLTLFDLGTESGVAFLVTELLVGETLRETTRRGPVSAKRAIDLGAQIARGLAAAHEAGIVHRDLKPENLFVTKDGTAKILDFGLAKLELPELAGKDLQEVSTVLETSAGTVLGAVGYMAPEQVRGARADARSDLFSLGVVLHELLSGAHPFRRGSVIESLNAILKEEPPELDTLAGATSPALARIVARLLEKDPDRRFRSAADLAFALEGLLTLSSGAASALSGESSSRRRPRAVSLAIAALVLAGAAAGFWLGRSSRPPASPAPAVRFELPPPTDRWFAANTVEHMTLAISPNGRSLAFATFGGTDAPVVWLRRFDESEAKPIAGTEGAISLTWSADGASLAFVAEGKLKRLDLAGGAPVPICDVAPGTGFGLSWGATGDLLFSPINGEAIYRVGAAGGEPRKVIEADPAREIERVNWPTFLPDGRGFFYLERSVGKRSTLKLVEGDAPPRDVAPLASRVELVAPDWLLFAREGALYAQRFDRAAARLVGSPTAVAPLVRYFYGTGWSGFAASVSGSIAYLSGQNQRRLTWFDRSGAVLGTVGETGDYRHLAIAPDGRSVLVDRTVAELGTYDLWQIDLSRGLETRVTTSPDTEMRAAWLPDGQTIVYSALRGVAPRLVRRELTASDERLLLPHDSFQMASSVSPDGRLLAYDERAASGQFHTRILDLDGDPRPRELVPEERRASTARFSPDGLFLAYLAEITGRPELYVAPVGNPLNASRVSPDGAINFRWSRAGGELVYLNRASEIVAVPVRGSRAPDVGHPTTLFQTPVAITWVDFDVSLDGDRILAIVVERGASIAPASVVVGWRPPEER